MKKNVSNHTWLGNALTTMMMTSPSMAEDF